MKNFSKKRFLLRVVILTIAFVVFITIPYAIGKLLVDPIGGSPIYTDGPTFLIGSLPIVNVSVPNQFTTAITAKPLCTSPSVMKPVPHPISAAIRPSCTSATDSALSLTTFEKKLSLSLSHWGATSSK